MTTATVGWIGFQEPHKYNVASAADAQAGGRALDSFVWGVQANQATAGLDPHLTVIGHSYGSTTSGIAAASDNPIDDLVLCGSPGIEVPTAAQLQVPVGHVYAARTSDDPIIALGSWFGTAPTDASFGAKLLSTDGGPTALDAHSLAASGHSEYFRLGTSSLDNFAEIVAGRPNLTTAPDPAATS